MWWLISGEGSVTGPYPATYLTILNGRKYDKQIQLPLTYFQRWGRDYYSCHFWSMNMKRTNYLGVVLWMDGVCKYHAVFTLMHRKRPERQREMAKTNTPVVSLAAIASSPRRLFNCYWWGERRRHRRLKQAHKWWRQMNKDFIQLRPDYMKIEGGNWRWMHNLQLKWRS